MSFQTPPGALATEFFGLVNDLGVHLPFSARSCEDRPP